MIKPLRKRHQQIWYALSVLLPGCIIMAWVAIPAKPINTLTQPTFSEALPKLIRSVKKEKYTMNLRCAENGANCQLEYINEQPLTIPSLLIYMMKPGAEKIDGHKLLGRIESRGSYHFVLPGASGNEATGFILYDFIHEQVLDTINF